MNDDLRGRATEARRLIRARGHAALATSLGGWPYVSFVAAACDMDASPLLLLSDLARHTDNLVGAARVAAVRGHVRPCRPARRATADAARARRSRCDTALAARFAARHPASAVYAGFADFHFYRVVIERGHIVAGFGRIAWIDGASLRFAGDAVRAGGRRARDRRVYELRTCRCRAALRRASARARRQGMADDRDRS